MNKVTEAISLESDLLLKLNPLSETEIFEFMKNLRGGTYFNMGMYSSIPVARAYKSTIRIYKVIDLTAIVSGVSYENIGTTKDFRDRTGETPGKSWYDHTPGFENKVGQKKSDPNSKYVLWDIKRGTGTCVRYYVVDIDTGAVTPVSKDDILNSEYLTQTEKNKLTPRPVVGIDLTTGQAVENKTNWRTAAFDHIFWLNQAGKATQEYGVRFEEDFNLTEAIGTDLFMDAHAGVKTDLDAILSGEVVESKNLRESTSNFNDQVISLFWEGLEGWTWDAWESAGASDKEDVAKYAISSLGEGVDHNFVYNLFWEWANSLDANSFEKSLEEAAEADIFMDAHAGAKTKLDDVLSGRITEAYRRTVSRGTSLIDNDLFVDFD